MSDELEDANDIISDILAKLSCMPMSWDEFLGESLSERIKEHMGYVDEDEDDEDYIDSDLEY